MNYFIDCHMLLIYAIISSMNFYTIIIDEFKQIFFRSYIPGWITLTPTWWIWKETSHSYGMPTIVSRLTCMICVIFHNFSVTWGYIWSDILFLQGKSWLQWDCCPISDKEEQDQRHKAARHCWPDSTAAHVEW